MEIKKKTLYDDKYSRPPVVYKEGEEVRLKQPQTKVGLKKKLRNDNWSEPRTITKVINDQNLEIDGKKVVNVKNIKKKEPARETNRTRNTVTRFRRISKARYKTE